MSAGKLRILTIAAAFAFTQLAHSAGVYVVIPGLSIDSTPGLITVTNVTNKPIPVSWIALKFNLPATVAMGEIDGTPWLGWENVSTDAARTSEYTFENRIPFPGGMIHPGQIITLEYSNPVETEEAAENVSIYGISTIYEEHTPVSLPVSLNKCKILELSAPVF